MTVSYLVAELPDFSEHFNLGSLQSIVKQRCSSHLPERQTCWTQQLLHLVPLQQSNTLDARHQFCDLPDLELLASLLHTTMLSSLHLRFRHLFCTLSIADPGDLRFVGMTAVCSPSSFKYDLICKYSDQRLQMSSNRRPYWKIRWHSAMASGVLGNKIRSPKLLL